MTDADFIAFVFFLGLIVAVIVESFRRRNVPAAVNALISFLVALMPLLVEFVSAVFFPHTVDIGPELPIWIAAAGGLHSVGMLGPYDTIWWWDHLTHTLSAGLVAAFVYAGFLVVGPSLPVIESSVVGIAFLTVLFTFVIGIFWELIEVVAREVGRRYGIGPVLVQYGRRDTALDLVFDVVGAILVVLIDLRIFVPVVEQNPSLTKLLFLGSGVITVLGSTMILLFVWVVRDREGRA